LVGPAIIGTLVVAFGVVETLKERMHMARKTAKKETAVAEPIAEPVTKKRAPRPSRYTEDLGNEICWLISQGSSFAKIALLPDMPTARTLYNWLDAHDDFAERFSRARELRADFRADRIDEIKADVIEGKIDPASARVAIEAERWLASKENPRKFSDRLDLNVSRTPLDGLADDELDERLAKLIENHGFKAITAIEEN
jgi:hypothetical protein